jgi:hypothetical protein
VLGSDRRGGLALADFRFEWPEPVILSHPFALLYNGAEARSWLLLSGFWSKRPRSVETSVLRVICEGGYRYI